MGCNSPKGIKVIATIGPWIPKSSLAKMLGCNSPKGIKVIATMFLAIIKVPLLELELQFPEGN
jgi:hypothetical protein